MDNIHRYIEEHGQEFVETLQRFCRQPSISSEGIGVREMVAILKEEMGRIGIETTVHETDGNPIVSGVMQGQIERTLMFYNHYDVQPPDPVEKWDSPPFAAEVRDGRIWSRGATDNKGNLLSRLKAVEAFVKVKGRVPIHKRYSATRVIQIRKLKRTCSGSTMNTLWTVSRGAAVAPSLLRFSATGGTQPPLTGPYNRSLNLVSRPS